MGRHGKNLVKSVPFAKPVPDFGKYIYPWEKDLLADDERKKIADSAYNDGVCTGSVG